MNTSAAPEPGFFSVGEITAFLKSLLSTTPLLSRAAVMGEVSGLTRHNSGHIYFSLKDDSALIRCVFFRGSQRGDYPFLKEGARVAVRGEVGIFEKRGEYQIYVRDMIDYGRGNILLQLEQLKKELDSKGYFAQERKRPLPQYPSCAGIVTASTGAALQDMLKVFREKAFNLSLVLYNARVQGQGSALEIAAGIDALNREEGVELIVVARGGGSSEDLWCFNELPVVEAIFRSKLPVVSAVGHEVDFTLADFVADVRAATPTQAAEMISADRSEIEKSLRQTVGLMTSRLKHGVEISSARLSTCSPGKIASASLKTIERESQWSDNLSLRIKSAVPRRLGDYRTRLSRFAIKTNILRRSLASAGATLAELNPLRSLKLTASKLERDSAKLEGITRSLERETLRQSGQWKRRLENELQKLNLLGPENVLKRGYIIASRNGLVIKDGGSIESGTHLELRFRDCKRIAEVTNEQ
ncbi:MAG: exodeoxyribonuclease VII large subunit [Candidatus Wallbacteria bacterium]|nr:exodeoxyribonuclease VII large subunit [Candidatus Wallbacteria bacterium]